ncbi:MAG: hypothetical protein WCP55_15230, partial [Lentisphaerota bacterium]
FTFWKAQGESLTPNIRFPGNLSGISISQLRAQFAPKWRYCAGIQAQYKTPLLCPRKIQNHVRSDRIWRDQVMEISRISGLTCRLVGGLPFAMLNEQMLKDGFGCLLTIPPNVKYVENFRKTASVLRN